MAEEHPRYGSFESYPTRFTDHEAWVFLHHLRCWRRFEVFEVLLHVQPMDEATYSRTFGRPAGATGARHGVTLGYLLAPFTFSRPMRSWPRIRSNRRWPAPAQSTTRLPVASAVDQSHARPKQ
jgi:hypothetical protein